MKRRFTLLFVLGLFALGIPATVAASDDPLLDEYNTTVTDLGGTPVSTLGGADVAVGNVVIQINPLHQRQLQFAGESTIQSGRADGILAEMSPDVRAHVNCVTANGNEATIGAVAENDNVQFTAGTEFFVTVFDNGDGSVTPDLVSFNEFGPDSTVSAVDGQCVGVVGPPYFPVVQGDIKVRDGQT